MWTKGGSFFRRIHLPRKGSETPYSSHHIDIVSMNLTNESAHEYKFKLPMSTSTSVKGSGSASATKRGTRLLGPSVVGFISVACSDRTTFTRLRSKTFTKPASMSIRSTSHTESLVTSIAPDRPFAMGWRRVCD